MVETAASFNSDGKKFFAEKKSARVLMAVVSLVGDLRGIISTTKNLLWNARQFF